MVVLERRPDGCGYRRGVSVPKKVEILVLSMTLGQGLQQGFGMRELCIWLCVLVVVGTISCYDEGASGPRGYLLESASESLTADSFRFEISLTAGRRVVASGLFKQPDLVQWGIRPQGSTVKQIAANGFVFTKIEGRNYWRVAQGSEELEWDPTRFIRRLLEAKHLTELDDDSVPHGLRGFTGTIPRDPFPDLLLSVWIDERSGLLKRIVFNPRGESTQNEAAPHALELVIWDYGVEATIDVPSRLLGGGVRVEGRMILRQLPSNDSSKLWRFCIEMKNVGYSASPGLDTEIVSGRNDSVPSGTTLYSLPRSSAIPAGTTHAYVGMVTEAELKGSIEDTHVRVEWIDQFGEYNHTLLLSKEYTDEPIGVSKDGRTCLY